MKNKYQELKRRLQEITDLNMAAAMLGWDQSTYMPPAGAPARGRQLATLGRVAHEKLIDKSIGCLLDDLEPWAESLPYESDKAALIRLTRHDFDRATKIPPQLLAEFQQHAAAAYQTWITARPANDFAAVQDNLSKTIDYARQIANCFPGYDHIADPLIDRADRGMKAESVRTIFAELRKETVPIVKAITAQEAVDDSCLKQFFPKDKQLAFGMIASQKFGYDLKRGRQDMTHHPFMVNFSIDDVRITTRVRENDLNEALFSTLHETGHALYELGISHDLEGTPLAEGTSSGVHESQSRLWENMVGRSQPFWNHYYPKLQAIFPEQLNDVPFDTFYRAINKVQPSLIRTDADEVTYNLHVMIRFDLELALLEGSLEVKDLPETWHARYDADLGERAPSHVDGVLQDIHWYGGIVGGVFQGYTLGNIMSALFFDHALQAHPAILAEIEQGKFDTLHTWLKDNIYRHGSKFTADELIERVTGGPLTIKPYIQYLRSKFGTLYDLDNHL
ncbi:MAG: carboxypeptidase M32 [Chloroflexi bacterium]|nr:carboxypeptidase M32 [Chloroflexota bacterium]